MIPCLTAQPQMESPVKETVPPPPQSGIRDEGGFFSKDPDSRRRIEERIRKLGDEHDFHIYLVVEPLLITGNAPELAAQLQQSWLPKGNGLVVFFESDNRKVGFGQDPGSVPDDKSVAGRVPTHETESLLLRATAAAESKLEAGPYLEALMDSITQEFNGYFERRAAPLPPGRSLRLGLLTVGGLALLALAVVAVGALVRLPAMAGVRTFRFPVVDRPERLGAPCGGGNVTVRKFKAGP
jgi:hypothetical protein